jgi:NADH-quinone oxidoreductase subunit E
MINMSEESVISSTTSIISSIDKVKLKVAEKEDFYDPNAIKAIIDSYIPILKDIQKKYPNLQAENLKIIALKLNLGLGQVLETYEIIEETLLEKIFSAKGRKKEHLIPILQAVQNQFSYLSKINMIRIAEHISMSVTEIYAVASFYSQFKFEKPGKHKLIMCLGTACYVKGISSLVEVAEKNLGIKPGETSKDGFITFETVACLGCCALSPVMIIDGEIHGNVTPKKFYRLMRNIKDKF